MNVHFEQFRALLEKASFTNNGDVNEKKLGQLTAKYFPNCEEFWRFFVVPYTSRAAGTASQPTTDQVREGIDLRLEQIGNSHYSLFIHLAYAHLHAGKNEADSIEITYIHLASACDLAEKAIALFYSLIKDCRGEKDSMPSLNKDEFLRFAEEKYQNSRENWQEQYLRLGKDPILRIEFYKEEVLQRYFGKTNKARKVYLTHSGRIRAMRNTMVHDNIVGRILDARRHKLIPKSEVINKYKGWGAIRDASKNNALLKNDFEEEHRQATQDLEVLEIALNDLWDQMLADLKMEFFNRERTTLRDLYKIQMTFDESPVDLFQLEASVSRFPPSGIATSHYFENHTEGNENRPGMGSADASTFYPSDPQSE